MLLENKIQEKLQLSLFRFIDWLNEFGPFSQDQYDFWATGYGRWAKSVYYQNSVVGTFLVSPLVFMDSFVPFTRSFFRKPSRFPIADAHFAMGFAYIYQATGESVYYQKMVDQLEALIKSRCPGYKHYAWGYPFQWMTNAGIIEQGTPLITSTPYVYEAFHTAYQIDRDEKWWAILHSIAAHVAEDYHDLPQNFHSNACSYIARDKLKNLDFTPVINANTYRAFLLLHAAHLFENAVYKELGEKNLNFVLDHQQSDGSWYYAAGKVDQFVDHFHTCFVLKNLAKISHYYKNDRCQQAIDRGLQFYRSMLFDSQKLPVPFAKKQRLVPYHRELYDYAECINLGLLLENTEDFNPDFYDRPLLDLLSNWQKQDGSFRTRKLWVGWNNVPYHRWAQSQLFRSLSLLVLQKQKIKS
ncbi:MAG: hypothetical protein JSW33_15280 [bacterium]|nr:MAG: hypothetical protein JSW33_15280 [bacterium]